MKYTINLPQSQQNLLARLLKGISVLNVHDQYDEFDITTLGAIFSDTNVDIKIELDELTYDRFSFMHGVDFPEYINK